ncbi:hypothetical protein ABI59_06560 [Acidobacteria bacterium Mor1]|nr:hypothetical protein ABI59_06560 [Acidobacteria bacterium Mor1]
MKAMTFGRALCAVAVMAMVLPVSAASLDEIVQKHTEAKGGKAAWDALQSLELSGTFRAFSKDAPFKMVRKQGNKYHLDTTMNGHVIVIGSDGEAAWWDHGMRGPGAKPIEGPDLAWQTREFDFTSPLIDWKAKGHTVELVSENSEYEGFPAIELKLTRADESEETWYLDPDTYLEMARVAPGSDFGRPMPARTFFDDFRAVNGVQIPHHVESQWYTRDRIFMVSDVKANGSIDDALFRMPAPPGMAPLIALAGKWNIKVEARQSPTGPFQESTATSTIAKMLKGGMMQEVQADERGNETIRQMTYDQFQKQYRITSVDNQASFMTVLEGPMEEGVMTVSNQETGTTQQVFGSPFFLKVHFKDMAADSFLVETEVSIDGGENWFVVGKSTYTRSE